MHSSLSISIVTDIGRATPNSPHVSAGAYFSRFADVIGVFDAPSIFISSLSQCHNSKEIEIGSNREDLSILWPFLTLVHSRHKTTPPLLPALPFFTIQKTGNPSLWRVAVCGELGAVLPTQSTLQSI